MMSRPPVLTPRHLTVVPGSGTKLSPSTIAAAPLRALERRWTEQLEVVTQWNDGTAALVLTRALAGLRESIALAEREESRISLKDAARRYGMPTSTLTWLCRTHAEVIGALKVRKEWSVDRTRFEQYLATMPRRTK